MQVNLNRQEFATDGVNSGKDMSELFALTWMLKDSISWMCRDKRKGRNGGTFLVNLEVSKSLSERYACR